MDIWTYFDQREQDMKDLSLVPDGDFRAMCAAERGSDDKRGRVFGRVWLTANAFLKIDEVVVVEGKHVRREEYGYFLVVDDEEVWGYERDLSHSPAVHKHTGGDHLREDSESVTFKWVVEKAWYDLHELAPQEFT